MTKVSKRNIFLFIGSFGWVGEASASPWRATKVAPTLL